jgi:hypothetical protein
MAWEIRQGDSLHLAAGLPDACLDAIVQDPPAGVDFLHKEWDGDKGGRDEWIAWLTAILKEGYRALKPGAWCVCWAIPRTSHWTSLALENAGFEVKHVVSHLFGSGFPHGLNIGKAMDKMRDDDIYHVTAFIAAARDKAGKTNPQIDAHFDYHGMAGHWTSSKSQPAVPTWDNWMKLKEFLGFGDDLDEEVQKLNGRKGKPGDPWYERPILGWETNGVQGHVFGAGGAKPTYNTEFAITGHVTAEAHAWDGWNTALKPGAEFWILGRKLGEFADSYGAVVAELDRLEAELCKRTALFVERNTPPTGHGSNEGEELLVPLPAPINSETEPEPTTLTGREAGGFGQTVMSLSEWTAKNSWSIVSSWRSFLADLWTQANRFTTETATAQTTVLKTLNSLLSRITPELLPESGATSERWSAVVLAVEGLLSVIRLTQDDVEGPTAQEPASCSPNSEFIILAQKPMAGRNYCSNILQYGVGALNIKGCAVLRGEGEEAEGWPANIVISHSPACGEECAPSCPIAELDRQSGTSVSRRAMMAAESFQHPDGFMDWSNREATERGHNDEGGASRFFNTFAFGPEDLASFVYMPKATRAEKDAGCKEAGIEPVEVKRVNPGGLEKDPRWAPKIVYNDHATIKSIGLMRWFLRLVCPKGGTIGDFFCGSGTTISAAILEGMNAIGFDLSARNVAIGSARAAYWTHRAEEAAEGGLPLLTLRTASPATLNRPKPRKPAPAFSFEDLFDEEEVAA